MVAGLWATVDTAIKAAPPRSADSVDSTGIWATLPTKLDPNQQRLRLIDNYVVQALPVGTDGKQRFMLKNPERATYISISHHELELLKLINPDQTLEQTCEQLLEEKNIFPYFIVGSLLTKLTQNGFVANMGGPLFSELETKVQDSTWRVRLGGYFNRNITLRRLNPIFGFVHDRFAHWLYRRPAVIALHLLALFGLITFAILSSSGQFGLTRFPHGFLAEIPYLILIQAVIIFGHEIAHGLTVKWAGKDVERGGLTLALFVPLTFYIETQDMWMETRKSRKLAVSWAGPLVNLLAVGLCCPLLFVIDPGSLLASVLYKTAAISLFLFFMNVNPFIETDGYFLLMDSLDIRSLNRKGQEFIKYTLWRKIKSGAPFTREQRVLTIYGLCLSAWSLVAAGLTLFFLWGLGRFLYDQWQRGGAWLHTVLIGLAITAILPMVWGLFQSLEFVVNRAIIYLYQRHYFHATGKLVALAAGVWFLFFAPPLLLHAARLGWWSTTTGVLVHYDILLLTTAIVAILTIRRLLPHRYYYDVFRAVLVYSAIIGVVRLGHGFLYAMDTTALITPIGYAIAGVVLALSMSWWSSAQHDPASSTRERFASTVPPFLAAPLAVLILQASEAQPLAARGWYMFGGMFWILATGAAISTYLHLRLTQFRVAMAALVIAAMTGTLALIAGASGGVIAEAVLLALSMGCLNTGLILFVLHLSRVNLLRPQPVDSLMLPDWQKLQNAFAVFVERSLDAVGQYFGPLKRSAVVSRTNNYLVQRAYGIAIIEDTVHDTVPETVSIVARGEIYSNAFRHLVDQMILECGSGFADRLLENLFDSLFWAEREVVTSYLFEGRAWDKARRMVLPSAGNQLFQEFSSSPLFSEFDESQVRLAFDASEIRTFQPQHMIVQVGETGDELFIIRSGMVDVVKNGQTIRTLTDLDYFGEVALVERSPRTASIVARTTTTCFRLGRDAFDRIVRPAMGVGFSMVSVINRVGVLRRLAFLRDVSPSTLALLLQASETRQYAPGVRIIAQGDPGNEFFIIHKGVVSVRVDTPTGELEEITKQSTGEYFGEIALLRDSPRTASVFAKTDVEVLVVSRENFDRFFRQAQQVRQFATRRLAVTKRVRWAFEATQRVRDVLEGTPESGEQVVP